MNFDDILAVIVKMFCILKKNYLFNTGVVYDMFYWTVWLYIYNEATGISVESNPTSGGKFT